MRDRVVPLPAPDPALRVDPGGQGLPGGRRPRRLRGQRRAIRADAGQRLHVRRRAGAVCGRRLTVREVGPGSRAHAGARPPVVAALVAARRRGPGAGRPDDRPTPARCRRCYGRLRYASRRSRNLELARLGGRVGRTYASDGGPQALRLDRAIRGARSRARAADRRGRRRQPGRMKGALMKVGPDGELPRRRPARAAADGPGRPPGPGAADEPGAGGRRRRRGARRPSGGAVRRVGPGADRGGIDRPGPPRAVVGPRAASGAGSRREGPVPRGRGGHPGRTWPTPASSAR